MVSTPNLDKMVEVKDRSTVVQDFIDWYCDEFVHCSTPHGGMLNEESDETHREMVMAAYFGIDLSKAEDERMAILEDVREGHRKERVMKRRKETSRV